MEQFLKSKARGLIYSALYCLPIGGNVILTTTPTKETSHDRPVRSLGWVKGFEEKYLLSGDDSGNIFCTKLFNQQHPKIAQTEKLYHVFDAAVAALTINNRLLAVSSVLGNISIFEIKQNGLIELVPLASYDYPGGEVAGLDFHPTKPILALGSEGGVVALWEIHSQSPIKLLSLESSANSVSWSPDGETLAVSSDDNNLYLIKLNQNNKLLKLSGHLHHVDQVRFSHCGRFISTGSHDATIRIWSSQTATCLSVIPHQLDTVIGDWAVDGRLVTCSYNKKVRVFSSLDGWLSWKEEGVSSIHDFDVDDCRFSPDGDFVASCDWNGTIAIHNRVLEPIFVNKGQRRRITSLASVGDKLLAGTSGAKLLLLEIGFNAGNVEVALTQEINTPQQGVLTSISVCTLPGKAIAAVTSSDGKLVLIDLIQNLVLSVHEPVKGEKIDIDIAKFSPDGQKLAVGLRSSELVLYELKSFELIEVFRTKLERRIKALDWQTSTKLIVGVNYSLRVFDVVRKIETDHWKAHSRMVNSVSVEKGLVVTASWDGWTKIFNDDGKLLWEAKSAYNVNSAVLSGQLVAAATWNGNLRVWTLNGKELVNYTTPQNTPLDCVQLYKNHAIAGAWDGNLHIINISQAKLAHIISLEQEISNNLT